jgi:hypothetical protein
VASGHSFGNPSAKIGDRVEGKGDTAEGAMADLTNKLRAIRPDPNG